MKKLIVLISFISLFISCKENVVDGFTSESVKKDIITALDGSEWVANSSSAYYEKIIFYKDVIHVRRGGSTQELGYAVSNVSSTMTELPEELQLRLKSVFLLDDLFLTSDYKELRSVYRSDKENTLTGDSTYKRVK